MDVKRYLPLSAALLALGVAGPAVALADDGVSDRGGAQVTAPAAGSVNDQGDDDGSVADEQQSGEQGDVENADLASAVEQEDAADQGDQGDDNNSAADEQQSGEQGDVHNSDLANEVEQEDGVAGSGSSDAEDQVDDSND